MQRAWELSMTGRYHNCADVLAQLKREGFEDLAYWQAAVHTHRKIDAVCQISVAALARGLPALPDGPLPDDEAIWRVIQMEIAANWMRDFETMAGCFVQEPRFRLHGSARSMGVTIREGWEDFARAVRADIAFDPDPSPCIAYGMELKNRNLTISGDMAWCTFTANCHTLDLEGFGGPGFSHDIRIMARHAGQWLCVLYGFKSIAFGQTDAALWEVDAKGRVLQQNPGGKPVSDTGGRCGNPRRAASHPRSCGGPETDRGHHRVGRDPVFVHELAPRPAGGDRRRL